MSTPLLEVEDLSVEYVTDARTVRAVDRVTFTVGEGEVFGLAGESGCGKSTIANAILRLLRDPAVIAGGSIRFRGTDVLALNPEQLREFRWRQVAMVFQSAMNSLNPVMTIGDQIADIYTTHEGISKKAALRRAAELLDLVGIPHDRLRSYPHQLSGGMRQRVALARALAQDRPVLLMDEPFAALDAITRDLLHDELERVWRATGRTIVFVTHNVREAARLGQRVVLLSSRPGRIAREWRIAKTENRRIESPEVAALAVEITAHLRKEIRRNAS